jgi:polar amino acid transport system ATP-binding protein
MSLADTGRTPAGAAPMVRVEAVHKRFGRLDVLRGITLDVPAGDVVCVLGPSGSGKTTLLRCINHLEKIDAGRIWVDGELVGYRQDGDRLHELREAEVARKRAQIGMVFQRFNLFAHMTALENVTAAPMLVKKAPRADAVARATELLERVGMADKLHAHPAQLSGGQQQRVAIARALVTQPTLLLADEPTGNLDSHMTVEVMALFQDLNAQGITILIVTHEPDVAKYGKRIVEVRDGRIIHDHPVAERRDAADDLRAMAPIEDEDAVTETMETP